jgi:hypothetical protein
MWNKGIFDYGVAHYFRPFVQVGNSIINGVEATGTNVLGGKVYEAPFLCGAVLTEHYDAVGTVATFYLDIHKLIY